MLTIRPLWPLVAALAVLAGCDKAVRESPPVQPPLVRTVLVKPARANSLQFTGVVRARVESDLAFRVPGKLVKRLVEPGQAVLRDQPIAEIDPSDYVLEAAAATSAVAAARSEHQRSMAELQRLEALVDRGFVSKHDLNEVRADADAAAARLRAAESDAHNASNQALYATLVADANGVVMSVAAEPGQVVVAGEPVIRLAHAGAREAVIAIPETARRFAGSTATAAVYDGARDIPAHLRSLATAANPATRTYEARYTLETEDEALPLGSTVTINLASSDAVNLQIPLAALYDRGEGPGVWLVSAQTPPETGATVSFRTVEVATLREETAELSGGVSSSDRIVAIGVHLLKEGQAVRVEGHPQQ
jgi:RND family efflux transporter MFP subunit